MPGDLRDAIAESTARGRRRRVSSRDRLVVRVRTLIQITLPQMEAGGAAVWGFVVSGGDAQRDWSRCPARFVPRGCPPWPRPPWWTRWGTAGGSRLAIVPVGTASRADSDGCSVYRLLIGRLPATDLLRASVPVAALEDHRAQTGSSSNSRCGGLDARHRGHADLRGFSPAHRGGSRRPGNPEACGGSALSCF